MNSYEKDMRATTTPVVYNPMFDGLIAVRTITATSTGPQLTTPVKRRSFKLANNISYPKSSIENNSEKHKSKSDGLSTVNSAAERKIRRKTFFERICGNKTTTSNAETPVKITSHQTNRFTQSSEEPREMNKPETDGKKKTVTNVCNGIIYGSTSTVDSSCLSIELRMRSSLEEQKNVFASLNIKKATLTKNTNSQLTFIPLADCLSRSSEMQHKAEKLEERFQNSKFATKFADLADDFEEWDGQWAEIDEKALEVVFSKGKY